MIRPFERALDLGFLNDWAVKRKVSQIQYQDIPLIGFMATVDGHPMASGFLRIIEDGMALMDGFILNPEYPRHLKNEILDGIVLKLFKKAEEYELRGILAYSHSDGIIERAQKHGFTLRKEERLLTIDLTGRKE